MKKYTLSVKATGQVVGEYYSIAEMRAAGVDFLCTQGRCELLDPKLAADETKLEGLVFKVDIDDEDPGEIDSFEKAQHVLSLGRGGFNPRTAKAVIALDKLLTIAEAWNKKDGFKPDCFNHMQSKYMPCFALNLDGEPTCDGSAMRRSPLGPLPCFQSHEKAVEFGKKFIGLYKVALRI